MWPAEWRVFLYCGGGLPREAIRRGRRSMRESVALRGSGIGWLVRGGSMNLVIISISKYLGGNFSKRDRRSFYFGTFE